MTRPMQPADYAWAIGFFLVTTLWLAWWGMRRMRRRRGVFAVLGWGPLAPIWFATTQFSWHWLHDPTADNLWPLGLALLAVPCAIVNWVLRLAERASARDEAGSAPHP